jgi:hypothetical protein
MSSSRIECVIHRKSSYRVAHGPAAAPLAAGRVPRVSRLLALAHKLDALVRQGTMRDYAVLARLGHVSRARISQIVALLHLAPDIQEEILFLPKTQMGHDRMHLRHLLPITRILDWEQQRILWAKAKAAATGPGNLVTATLRPRSP